MGTRIERRAWAWAAVLAGLIGAVAPVSAAPPPFHAAEPTPACCCGLQLMTAQADLPTTPQVPTPPPKKEETPAPAPAPLPGMTGDSLGDSAADTVSTFDSAVGYIDDPIPGTYIRFRFDSADGNNRPSRAEYFYAKGGPFGPGFKDFAGIIDFEEISLYAEVAFRPQFSCFIDAPWRIVDQELEDRTDGFGDLNFGFKYAFIYERERVVTFQLRAWTPTGDVREGLSTGHATIEPGVLFYRQLSPMLRAEAEFLYWIPIGGTDFAGDVIQYGVGLSYGPRRKHGCWLSPVVECVGWTVLSGKEQVGPSPFAVQDAAGDDILNIKAGFRLGFGDRANMYFGYGRALTGDVWYKDIVRAELRLSF